MINGYIKPFRELDEEKDQLIQISYEGEDEWRVTTTRHSYLAQGYQLELGDKIK
jgi:hypothetical protein